MAAPDAPPPLAVTLTDQPVIPAGAAPVDEDAALRVDLVEPTPPPATAQAKSEALDATPDAPEIGDDAPLVRPKPGPAKTAAIWLLAGCAVLALVQVPLLLSTRRTSTAAAASASSATASASASTRLAAPAGAAGTSSAASEREPEPSGLPPFRVVQLEQDPALEITRAKVGKKGCEAALLAIGIEKSEVARVAKAIAPLRKLSACRASDQLFVAATRDGRTIRALEIETAPGELIQVRERRDLPASAAPAPSGSAAPSASANAAGSDDELIAAKVSLPVSHRRQAVGFLVKSDLAAAVVDAGLDAAILDPLDDAIESRGDLGTIGRGAVFRLVADATYVAGRFDRYDKLVAFEYRPSLEGKPIRVYNLPDPPPANAEPKSPPPSWYDATGKQATRSRWRMPLLMPRVTSRFNPRRMHPILHTIMPHNGCDFGAPAGTAVYAIGPGVVTFRGNAGATGNFVSIQHEGGFESGYAHLSRFAPGIGPGSHIEARQLVGYVGSTGRSTGPHLHLSVKLNGQFIDPLTLRLDAKKVVPPKQRDAFAKQRSDADAALDAIALPKPDKGDHPAPAGSAAPAPSTSASADEIDDEHPQ